MTKDYADSLYKEAFLVKKREGNIGLAKKNLYLFNEGLVLGVLRKQASINEIANLEEVLHTADLPENIPSKADKVCQSKKHVDILKTKTKRLHSKESL